MPGSKEPWCKRHIHIRHVSVFNFIMKKSKSKLKEQSLLRKKASGANEYSTLT